MPKGKHNNHVKGSQHYRWNSQKIGSDQGYTRIRVGKTHPFADPNGYAYEHLLVLISGNVPEAMLLRTHPEKYVVHHVNGEKSDNRIENLQVLTRSEHNALHNAERERDQIGRFIGKKVAGRLLDGREWNEYSEAK